MKTKKENLTNFFAFFSSLSFTNSIEFTSKRKILKIPKVPINFVITLLDDLTSLFSSENVVLKVKSPVVIVGDLHGQILDLLRILKNVGSPSTVQYLFLGDYVDRGQFSFETIMMILVMKLLWPKNVHVLRGNHEFEEIFRNGGFSAELNELYPLCNIDQNFQECFAQMPLAAIVDDYVFCVHGGIGPSVLSVDYIEKIQRPVYTFEDNIVSDILWSDPTEYILNFQPSARGSGHLFGINKLTDFLHNSNLKVMIRGHQCEELGVVSIWDNACFTVFSASNYCGVSNNKAGILKISPDKNFESSIFDQIGSLFRNDAYFFDVRFNYNNIIEFNDGKMLPYIKRRREKSAIVTKLKIPVVQSGNKSENSTKSENFNPRMRKLNQSNKYTPQSLSHHRKNISRSTVIV